MLKPVEKNGLVIEFISGLAAKESHYNDIIASEMAQMEEKYYRLLNRTQAK